MLGLKLEIGMQCVQGLGLVRCNEVVIRKGELKSWRTRSQTRSCHECASGAIGVAGGFTYSAQIEMVLGLVGILLNGAMKERQCSSDVEVTPKVKQAKPILNAIVRVVNTQGRLDSRDIVRSRKHGRKHGVNGLDGEQCGKADCSNYERNLYSPMFYVIFDMHVGRKLVGESVSVAISVGMAGILKCIERNFRLCPLDFPVAVRTAVVAVIRAMARINFVKRDSHDAHAGCL